MLEKKSLISHIFNVLKPLQHVYLGLNDHLSDQNDQEFIHVLMPVKAFDELFNQIKSDSTVEHFKVSSNIEKSVLKIALKNGSSIQLVAQHAFLNKNLTYLETEAIYQYAITTPSGLKLPSSEHRFEYAVLSNFLNGRAIDERHFHYFESFHVLMQEDLVDYFNNKYNTDFSSLYNLLLFSDLDRLVMYNFIKTLPSNRFIKKINIRWNSLKVNLKKAK